jgi:hypothetical protein
MRVTTVSLLGALAQAPTVTHPDPAAPVLTTGHEIATHHPECGGGKWGGFDAVLGTIRRETDMPRGSGICFVCGERLRLNYHGLIPSHDNLRISV